MPEQYACDLFGGKDKVITNILNLVSLYMKDLGMQPQEYSNLINIVGQKPDRGNIVRDLLSRRKSLDENLALNLMFSLGIAIEDTMPLVELTAEQRQYWEKRYRGSGQGLVESSTPASPEGLFQLYIRMQALKELNPISQVA